jgi:hypothetical protein
VSLFSIIVLKSGANVIDYEFPSFKLYDSRVNEEYYGRFAIFSNNTDFKIYKIKLNDVPQQCNYGRNKNQVFPDGTKFKPQLDGEKSNVEDTTKSNAEDTTKAPRKNLRDNESCGKSKKSFDFKQFALPSNFGNFPFAASIYQLIDADDDLYGQTVYKCSGTILNKNLIITSVNCILDDNSRLLKPEQVQVQLAQYSLSSDRPAGNSYNVRFFCVR